MTENVTSLDDHRVPPPAVWPIGSIQPYRSGADDYPELQVDGILEQGYGESVRLTIADIDTEHEVIPGIEWRFEPADAIKLAHLLLSATNTLARNIFPTKEVDD